MSKPLVIWPTAAGPVLRVVTAGLLTGLAFGSTAVSCREPTSASPCHEMRKCITLTCRDRVDDGDKWESCVRWCQQRFDVPTGEDAVCARVTARLCLTHPWEGEECVAARNRCFYGQYIEPGKRC